MIYFMAKTLADKIFELIDVKQIDVGTFADMVGIERSSLSHIKTGRSKPTLDMVKKIRRCFPEVSLEWLICDEVDTPLVLHDSQATSSNSKEHAISNQSELNNGELPLFNISDTPDMPPQQKAPITIASSQQTPDNTLQHTEKKHITRIIVFYSDSSYEELVRK